VLTRTVSVVSPALANERRAHQEAARESREIMVALVRERGCRHLGDVRLVMIDGSLTNQ
jgi:hypothetical protein